MHEVFIKSEPTVARAATQHLDGLKVTIGGLDPPSISLPAF